MSNLKEVSTQRLSTDWTQPMVWLLSTTVSVTLKSQPVNHCRPFTVPACQVWFCHSLLLLLLLPFRPEQKWFATASHLLIVTGVQQKKKKKQTLNVVLHRHPNCDATSLENREESAECPRWTNTGAFAVFIIQSFPGNIKIKHKHVKSSILNVDCYLETKDICWHENPNPLLTTAQVTF